MSSNKCRARSQAEAARGWSASTGRTAAVVFAAAAQRESSQRHGACGAAMHAACARCLCRRAATASSGRAQAAAAALAPLAITPIRQLAAAALGRGMQHGSMPLIARALTGCGCYPTELHSAHAACRCDVRSPCCGCENNCGGTPRARASAEAASAWLRAGQLFCSPQPSREPQRYAPSSPPARKRLPCAAGGAAF